MQHTSVTGECMQHTHTHTHTHVISPWKRITDINISFTILTGTQGCLIALYYCLAVSRRSGKNRSEDVLGGMHVLRTAFNFERLKFTCPRPLNETLLDNISLVRMTYREPSFLTNRAAAYIKLQKLDEGLEDCKRAVFLNPSYARAHGRMG